MFDLKVLNSALDQLSEERGIPKEKTLAAIEDALAAAYRKDYGKRGQIVRAQFDKNTGGVNFEQVRIVVDESMLKSDEEDDIEPAPTTEQEGLPKKIKFNEEHHIMLEDARRIKRDAKVGDELVFPLEPKDDYGRIAAQTAKQIIMQKIREAERGAILEEFGKKVGEIVSGHVQRIERGTVFVDLGRATGVLYRIEQIPGEHYRPGERIRALLLDVEDGPRGINLRLSRANPNFVTKLFAVESPEIASGTVEIKAIAREAGVRTKIALASKDDSIDPIGAAVGQHGVRVNTVISELGGEKIDITEWSEIPENFIAKALQPGRIMSIELDEENKDAIVTVAEDQLSLIIGRGGQNVRLAAKLCGWRLDIVTPAGRSRPEPVKTEIKDETLKDEEVAVTQEVAPTEKQEESVTEKPELKEE